MGILDLMNSIQSNTERGFEQGKERKLADLYSNALGAAPDQRQGYIQHIAGVSPGAAFDAQKHFEGMDENARASLGRQAAVFSALPEEMKAQAYQPLASAAQAAGLPVPQGDYRPEYSPGIAKLASLGGVGAGVTAEQQNFASMTSQFTPEQIQDARMVQAGLKPRAALPSVFDAGTAGVYGLDRQTMGAQQFNVGGPPKSQQPQQPQGGAATLMQGAYSGATDPQGVQSAYQGLAQQFPGVQISSLGRSPAHNREVGGVANSQHISGTAGDFVVPQAERQQFIANARQQGFEAIDEGDHVHLELPRGAALPGQQGGQPLVRTPAAASKDTFAPLSQDEVAQMGLPAGTVAQRNVATGAVSVLNKPSAAAGDASNKPIPVGALKPLLEVEDALSGAESAFSLSAKHLGRIADRSLEIGPAQSLSAKARTTFGQANANDVNYNELKADRTKLVNDSLRLNKGVQTEGDAKRAADEMMNSDDEASTVRAFKRLVEINKRGMALQQRKRETIMGNYGRGGKQQGGQQPAPAAQSDDVSDLLSKYGG